MSPKAKVMPDQRGSAPTSCRSRAGRTARTVARSPRPRARRRRAAALSSANVQHGSAGRGHRRAAAGGSRGGAEPDARLGSRRPAHCSGSSTATAPVDEFGRSRCWIERLRDTTIVRGATPLRGRMPWRADFTDARAGLAAKRRQRGRRPEGGVASDVRATIGAIAVRRGAARREAEQHSVEPTPGDGARCVNLLGR